MLIYIRNIIKIIQLKLLYTIYINKNIKCSDIKNEKRCSFRILKHWRGKKRNDYILIVSLRLCIDTLLDYSDKGNCTLSKTKISFYIYFSNSQSYR